VRKPNQRACEESYILIKEAHCLGFNESKQRTVREWKKDQGLDIYNEMNDLLMDVLSLKNRSGKKRLSDKENELFYTACYDLDRFRGLAFEKRLWVASSAGDGAIEAIQEDDVALMRFGIEWIMGTLF
ncbi:MAG: YkgJ family cysteine cluster protein, partial [Desulfobacterales bacterium]|nr:YkgJ family cysteine cluster protein [Desulfobacterales bacterium]